MKGVFSCKGVEYHISTSVSGSHKTTLLCAFIEMVLISANMYSSGDQNIRV